MARILLVFTDLGIKKELSQRLRSEIQDFTVYQTTSTNEAKKYLGEQAYDLAIVDLHVPIDDDTMEDADKTSGLDLVHWMRNSSIETPTILVRPKPLHTTPELDIEIGDLFRCTPVDKGQDLFENMEIMAKKFLSGETPEQREILEIELRLRGKKTNSGENAYSIFLTAPGSQRLLGKGGFSTDGLDIDVLTALTEDIATLPERRDMKWKRRFRLVGQRLREMLKSDPGFYAGVKEALQKIGHPKDYSYAHLRFVIPRELHAIALEAVIDLEKNNEEEDDSDLWMLEAPVYRMLYGKEVKSIKVGPLFTDKSIKPISCLLIDANVGDDKPIKTNEPDPRNPEVCMYLSHLPMVSEECDWLKQKLKEQMQHLNIAEPVLLRREPGEQGFLKRVEEQLKKEWDLVHYAGHSYYNEDEKLACFFFQEDDDNVEKLTIKDFVKLLGSARFVFLSSCQSASEGFVFELAESGVPAIIGFRWPIEDESAVGFVQCFYEHLFESKSVEEAFFLARRHIHDEQKERKVWTSPVLIEQGI